MAQRRRSRKRRVLVATNRSGDEYALDYGVRLAESLGAELDHWMIVETVDEWRAEAPALEQEKESWKDREPAVQAELKKGLAVEILSRLQPQRYRLVLLRFRGRRGLKKVFPRSEILSILRHGKVSFLVLQRRRRQVPKKVLVCTGGSVYAQQAAEFSARLLGPFGVQTTVFHVAETQPKFFLSQGAEKPELDPRMARAMARARRPFERAGSETTEKVRFGKVADQILAETASGRFDLIVVASHGESGIRHLLLGSVPEELVKRARIPLLIVRATKTRTIWSRLFGRG
ncbi:MAG: universal stress protein [Candidatus Thermoplasmatota archaeon]|nr:universal stress protein [Candidatus Thermoplasmatota archaeon]